MTRAAALLALVSASVAGAASAGTPPFAAVVVEESPDLPAVDFTVALLSGSAMDPPDRWGLARFTAEMLLRGTRTRSQAQIAEELDRLGASLTVAAAQDSVTLSGETLSRNLDAFLSLVSDLVVNPAFDASEFEKLRTLTGEQLRQARDEDRQLAQRKFREVVLAGHPYGHDPSGTVSSVASFTLDDVKAFHARNYVARNIAIGAAGDVERGGLRAALARHFGALRAGAPAGRTRYPEPPRARGRRVLLVDKPARNQCQIYVGHPGLAAAHADHFAFSAGNEVFGGGRFSTTLMREVRVKRGLSYGAYGVLSRRRGTDLYGVWVFPAAAQAMETLELVLRLYEDFVAIGPSPADFEDARSYLVLKSPFLVETPAKRVSQRLEALTLGVPRNYAETYGERMSKVTLAKAVSAVRRYCRPADLSIVMVCTAADFKDAAAKLPGVVSVDVVPFDADGALPR